MLSREMTRDEKVAEARRLHDDMGASIHGVARALDVSYSTARRWIDPEVAERHLVESRARKESYRGTCERCGASTNGSNGPGTASRICIDCLHAQQTADAVWTRGRLIVEAFRWYRLVGRFPTSTDWFTNGGPHGVSERTRRARLEFRALTGPWPSTAIAQNAFGSWPAFIAACGGTAPGTPRGVGWYQAEREFRAAIERVTGATR